MVVRPEMHMHNINKMVYVGIEPWHWLGVRLPANATYRQIAELAGFYTAEEKQLFIEGSNLVVPDKKAVVRGDDGRYLATVGSGYRVVQFAEVAKTLVEATGLVGGFFHTAGTLGPVGARGWLLGDLQGDIVVKGDPSPIKKYLLGTTGHDGLSAINLKNVATRVVCQNTLGLALGERGGASFKIHHTTNAGARLAQAAAALKKLLRSYETFGELANFMAVTPFTDKQMKATIDVVLPAPKDETDHLRIERDREKVLSLFETAVGLESAIKGTSWAAANAWSEFLDHVRLPRAKKGHDLRDQRLESIWMGSAAKLKEQAFYAILHEAQVQPAAA